MFSKYVHLVISIIVFWCFINVLGNEPDFYDLLAISRNANNQEIRKAFKKMALKMHPDKNVDDPKAHENFLKITRAYEILKQPETRRHYDVHGDTGSDFNENNHYQSYSYYRDEFGIYDDDPLIITLSASDYEVNILDDTQAWFVNFYSPRCHHCHELAPTWRKIAKEFQGVIKVAAVNCEDDWALCYQLSIPAYPTLMFFDKQASVHEGKRFTGRKTFESIEDFILSEIPSNIEVITTDKWKQKENDTIHCLFFFCTANTHCLASKTQIKLAAALGEIMDIFVIMDDELAKYIYEDYRVNPVIYWRSIGEEVVLTRVVTKHPVSGSDFLEIIDKILNLLPSPPVIDEDYFKQIRLKSDVPWLLCFYMGSATDLDLQLKRLPSLLSNSMLALVHCGKSSRLCSELHISSYPVWGVLKIGGAFELHHGRGLLHDILIFARDSIRSVNLRALSPKEFEEIRKEDGMWFVDWYAPWCPPCKRLMPELRRASQHFGKDKVQFGTIDCTLHRSLCSREGISAYPTTILYNGSKTEHFHGVPNEDGIVSFLVDVLNSNVISLNDSTFVQLMRKPTDEIWFVDYFAPWCGPCQKLSLQWRKLSQEMVDFAEVKIAQIDCVANAALCSAQKIKAYPTLRLYPFDSKGLNSVIIYKGNWELDKLKQWLLHFIPSHVEELSETDFDEKIRSELGKPLLVYFFAPWCKHCVHFDIVFRKVAKEFKESISCTRVNCQVERSLCNNLYIDGYPTILLYVSSNQRYEITARNVEDIVRRVTQLTTYHKQKQGHDEL